MKLSKHLRVFSCDPAVRGESLLIFMESRCAGTSIGSDLKSGNARHIPLGDEALEAFTSLFLRSSGKGRVFVNIHGEPVRGYKHWFGPAVKAAGIPHFTWYCLRHTFASWLVMREHCYHGYQMVKKIPFLSEAAEIVYAHQERFDGTDYPRGLKGKEILLGARIVAVTNTLDSITSDLPYRPAQS